MPSHRETIYQALGRESIHPFPARMAPGIVLDILSAEAKPIRVLDPMMGSGTVLALAHAKGHKAVGVDIDPLAVLISRVWTTAIDRKLVERIAHVVLRRARDKAHSLRDRSAYPKAADEDTRRFISYWFDRQSRIQLTALSGAIRSVRDKTVRNVLWCAFSRLIITKQAGASLAKDLAHSRPHKSYTAAPIRPFEKFQDAVRRVTENCATIRAKGGLAATHEGDARQLPIRSSTIDLVLTSPPYLNAIDYIRCSKFSLVWMGYSLSELSNTRKASVGTEAGDKSALQDPDIRKVIASLRLKPRLARRQEAILAHYISDMRRALREVARVLVRGGRAIYVVGENTVRGTYIKNSRVITAVAKLAGLDLQYSYSRALPANRRYLPPPSRRKRPATLDARLRREVVLSFVRSA